MLDVQSRCLRDLEEDIQVQQKSHEEIRCPKTKENIN